MSDITTLLQTIAPDVAPPTGEMIDADLARGRAALVRAHRRQVVRRATLGTTSLVVVAAIGVVATQSSTTTPPPTPTHVSGAHRETATAPKTVARSQVRLVDYAGAQLPGFTVAEVPQGWQLSTSTSTALLITRDGSTNNDPDVFLGKLAVLTSSIDQNGLGDGDPVTVNGQPGRVSRQPGVLMLSYNTANGFGVDIQAPTALGWDDQEIVAFAEGVKVTANAVHTEG
jgi:hypothetical protein